MVNYTGCRIRCLTWETTQIQEPNVYTCETTQGAESNIYTDNTGVQNQIIVFTTAGVTKQDVE